MSDEMVAARIWAAKLYIADADRGESLTTECQDLAEAKSCALKWAGNANEYVCSYVLKDDVEGVKGIDLAREYYEGAVPIIDELVTKAGRRLGAWINALAVLNEELASQREADRLLHQPENQASLHNIEL